MTILWICGLPGQVQREVAQCHEYRTSAEWSWILGHLPPPKGVNLHIACPVTSGPWKDRQFHYQGASFHLVRCLKGRLQTGFLFDPFFFRRLFNQIRPDIVHGWGTEDSHSIIALNLSPRKHVVQVQGLINAYGNHLGTSAGLRYVAARERMTLRRARNVFVESNYSREISQPYCGRQTRVWQVDHPLRREFFTSLPSPRKAKQVLSLGSLTDRKGYLDAIAAFASAPPEWRLVMIGDGKADAVAKLTDKVAHLGLRNRFHHIAAADTPSIIQQMQSSSIYLLPSYIDTGPTSLKEALAMNLWPVCYNNTGPAELLTRFHVGSLSPTGDLSALASALRHATSDVPGMASNSLSRVQEPRHAFSRNTIWLQLLQAYATIVDSPSRKQMINCRLA